MSVSCTPLFVSISQVIGCEDRLRNDLHCVGWGVKLYSLTTHSLVFELENFDCMIARTVADVNSLCM